MPEETGKRIWIGGAGLGSGSIIGVMVSQAIEVAEKATAPPSVCAQALAVMSENLSACMQMHGGG